MTTEATSNSAITNLGKEWHGLAFCRRCKNYLLYTGEAVKDGTQLPGNMYVCVDCPTCEKPVKISFQGVPRAVSDKIAQGWRDARAAQRASNAENAE